MCLRGQEEGGSSWYLVGIKAPSDVSIIAVSLNFQSVTEEHLADSEPGHLNTRRAPGAGDDLSCLLQK